MGTVDTPTSLLQIVSASSERTELALDLRDIPAIPRTDPTLILRRLRAGREHGRRKVEEALPLRARAHRCAAPTTALRVRQLARGRSGFGQSGLLGPVRFRLMMEHELGRDVLAQRAHHARHLAPAHFRAARLYRRRRGRRYVKGGGAGREDGRRDAVIRGGRRRGGGGVCGVEEDDGAQFAAGLFFGPDREHHGRR